METNKTRIHPLLAVAAVSVTLVSLAGVGVLTGLIPSAQSGTAPATAAQMPTVDAATPMPPAATSPAPAVEAANTAAPAPVHGFRPWPAAKSVPTMPEPTIAAAPPPAMAPPPPTSAPVAPPICYECGTIQSVRQMVQQGQGTGLGAVAGGVLGGVLGHQMGHGRGNDAATVLGAVGGAYAGHEVEKSQRKSVHYEIAVRMDDGRMQVLRSKEAPGWREGERVRVINGALAPIGQQY